VFIASQCGHTDVVEKLLRNRADVSMARLDGVTPVVITGESGHVNTAASLTWTKSELERAMAECDSIENVRQKASAASSGAKSVKLPLLGSETTASSAAGSIRLDTAGAKCCTIL